MRDLTQVYRVFGWMMPWLAADLAVMLGPSLETVLAGWRGTRRRTAMQLMKGPFAEEHHQRRTGSLQGTDEEVQVHQAATRLIEGEIHAAHLIEGVAPQEQRIALRG